MKSITYTGPGLEGTGLPADYIDGAVSGEAGNGNGTNIVPNPEEPGGSGGDLPSSLPSLSQLEGIITSDQPGWEEIMGAISELERNEQAVQPEQPIANEANVAGVGSAAASPKTDDGGGRGKRKLNLSLGGKRDGRVRYSQGRKNVADKAIEIEASPPPTSTRERSRSPQRAVVQKSIAQYVCPTVHGGADR